jgi:hypothetical protein
VLVELQMDSSEPTKRKGSFSERSKRRKGSFSERNKRRTGSFFFLNAIKKERDPHVNKMAISGCQRGPFGTAPRVALKPFYRSLSQTVSG